MTPETTAMIVAPLAVSALLTGMVRRYAFSLGLLDVPNERSSHRVPTARGGGAAIVLTTLVSWLILMRMGRLQPELFAALAGGGVVVAIVGFIDDRWGLSAGTRLAIHVVAALWATASLGGLPAIHLGDRTLEFGWAGYALGVVGIVWVLNLFNFMDGIDGIAASEAVFVAWGAALLAVLTGTGSGVSAAALVLGAAASGFLVWNWPPAKIFMGDVGSGYLGYVIAVLALGAAHRRPSSLVAWLLLGGLFFVDATVTVVRRLARGERPHQAHRTHAYQWLARRWNSHKRVTVLTVLVNVLWLLPGAFLALAYPRFAGWIACIALAPLVVVLTAAGAGRREPQVQASPVKSQTLNRD